MKRAIAIYLGCALIAAWCILRAWDHFHGRPIQPDPWAEDDDGLPPWDPHCWPVTTSDRVMVTWSRN